MKSAHSGCDRPTDQSPKRLELPGIPAKNDDDDDDDNDNGDEDGDDDDIDDVTEGPTKVPRDSSCQNDADHFLLC